MKIKALRADIITALRVIAQNIVYKDIALYDITSQKGSPADTVKGSCPLIKI